MVTRGESPSLHDVDQPRILDGLETFAIGIDVDIDGRAPGVARDALAVGYVSTGSTGRAT